MLIILISSFVYLVLDYFFKKKDRIVLWSLFNVFVALLFILITTAYIGKFIIYFWYPYFFILTAGLIIIAILRLLQFIFFPFLFWRKKELGQATYIEWSQIFKGKRIPLYKMIYFSEKLSCPNYPHTKWEGRFQYIKGINSNKTNGGNNENRIIADPNWVFEPPMPSYKRAFVYINGYIYVICTKCKTQLDKQECKPGTMMPLDKYDIYYDEEELNY
jgi:hypothetical protein